MKQIKKTISTLLLTALYAVILCCDGDIYDNMFNRACTLTYDGNSSTGGAVPAAPVTYRDGDVVTVLDNAGTLAKTGYIFSGWNTHPDGIGTTYTAGSMFIIKNSSVVLYALWAATVTFNANGGTGTMTPQEIFFKASETLNANTFTRAGYTFFGWSASSVAVVPDFLDQSSYTMTAGDVTLYAVWTTGTIHYIYNDSDLNNVRSTLGDIYILMSDINLSVNYSAGWTPIGTDITPFTGIFYGDNHTISSMTINTASNFQGLFGYTSGATIQNLDLTGVAVTGGDYVGALAGYSAGSTINNCSVSGGTVSGTNQVGGMIGENSGGLLTNCSSSNSVNCNTSTTYNIGGLAGTNSGTIDYCYGTGTVTGYYNVGGLIGTNSGAITHSHTSASASVIGSLYCGGLIGWNSAGGALDSCYAENSVSGGTFDTGGLIGRNFAVINRCYSKGNVSGTTNVGGFIGLNRTGSAANYCYETGLANGGTRPGFIAQQEGTCSFSYFNSANTDNGIGIPATLASMQIQATFTGWDFASTWSIGSLNGGYPYLTAIPPSF